MAFPGVPIFPGGIGLQNGDTLNNFVHNTLSVDMALRARIGGGQQFATLVDSVVNVVSRSANTGDSIQLPPTNGPRNFGPYLGGLQLLIINSGANPCQLFGNYFETSTIGGVSGSVGVTIGVGASIQLCCGAPGVWIAISGGSGGGLPFTGGQLTGGLGFTTNDGIAAAGTDQGSATLLITQVGVIVTVPVQATSGVRLPGSGDMLGAVGPTWLKNTAGNDMLVYPPTGGQINSTGTNLPIQLDSGGSINFYPGLTSGQWWTA